MRKSQEAAAILLVNEDLGRTMRPEHRESLERYVADPNACDSFNVVFVDPMDSANLVSVLVCESRDGWFQDENENTCERYKLRTEFAVRDSSRSMWLDIGDPRSRVAFWSSCMEFLVLLTSEFSQSWSTVVWTKAEQLENEAKVKLQEITRVCNAAIIDLRKGMRVNQDRALPKALLPKVPEGHYVTSFWDYNGNEERTYKVNVYGSWANFVRTK